MFSKAQEADLGDAVTEQMRRSLQIYPQAGLTDKFDEIASRLTPFLPGSDYRFQFSLIELGEANAFAIPGGRIFVSRKLVKFVSNEDELAGVLAHEMGHVVARQGSVNMTRMFADTLKVHSVGDRQDVFRQFHRLLDLPPSKTSDHKEEDQLVADRASLEAVWRAGYDPQALAQFLDRVTDNKGATGSFLTDLFGATRPESKRIREILKDVEAIPAACRQARASKDEASFRNWQGKVTELSPEDLIPAPSDRKPLLTLQPHLQPELTNIRFSPDGQLLLAQQETGIDVLRRTPLTFLFRIPARLAGTALFGADSKRVIFVSSATRVEVWNVETRARERRWEPDDGIRCQTLLASPDGRTAACLAPGSPRSVRLFDMESNREIARHEFSPGANGLVQETFSPDGSAFLLTTSYVDAPAWAFNPATRAETPIRNQLKGALVANARMLAFLGPDRIAAFNPTHQKDSGVFSWPEGKLLSQAEVPTDPFRGATRGPVLLVHGKEYAVAALNLDQHKIFQVSRNPGMDFYGDIEAAERRTGEVAIYSGGKTEPSAVLQLPEAELGRLRSSAISLDLQYVALSIQNRGAVWDLKSGKSLAVAPFTASGISSQDVWTATLEETEAGPAGQGDHKFLSRQIIDLRGGTLIKKTRLPDPEKNQLVLRRGEFELTIDRATTPSGKTSFHILDTAADHNLWSQQIDGSWRITLGQAVLLNFPSKNKEAEEVFKDLPHLKALVQDAPKPENTELLDVRDVQTGKRIGGAVVEGGTGLAISEVLLAGKTLFVVETSNRTLAYSLDTGERRGQQFGQALATNSVRELAAISNQVGRVTVVDNSMNAIADFSYPGVVLRAAFDSQGKRLLVITSKQEVFVDNLP